MSFSGFKYLTKTGLSCMVRNRLMSVASIGVLTVCLLITGAAALFTLNVGSLMDYLGSQNETVVYLDREITEEGLAAVDSKIRSISGLSEVTYETKEDALDSMRESMGDDGVLFDVFEGDQNPFAACYRIVLTDITQLPEIKTQLEAIPGVIDVGAPVQLAEIFTNVHQAVSLVCIVLVAVLGFVSTVVISNTIRLTVFARRKEINIMKYVGATNGFIRLPFFVEGVAVGLIAGAIASALVLGGYQLITIYSVELPGFWSQLVSGIMLPLNAIWWKLMIAFFGFGALIGSIGTASSIRKYLKV